jgi:F0F1-type ATP synthase assembly protein I
MEKNPKRSFFEKVPSWLLAALNFILAAIFFVITDSIWTPHTATGLKSHLINDLIIAVGCFFIVRLNPKSKWYVPIISNALLIVASFAEPNFWHSQMVIPICGGWVLSVLVSIVAAQLAKST